MKAKASKYLTNNVVTYLLVIVAFAVIMGIMQTGHMTRHMRSLLVPVCVNIILAVSLNLVIGFLGDLSLGHASFMSVGAYAGCLFSKYFADSLPSMVRFPLAILTGAAVAALFGLLVGIPVLRLKGDYLAIVTLAFGEIIRSVIINLQFTGGPSGLKGTPQDSTFLWAFALVMITLFCVQNLTDSRHGRAIMSIRDNRIAAESCGIDVNRFKLLTFIVSAAFAGVAGVLYGHNFSILNASTFDYNLSIEILVMVVLGGMGSIRGSIIAATVITVLPEALRFLSDYRMLIYAVVLIALMLFNQAESLSAFKSRLRIGKLFRGVKKNDC